MTTLLPHRRGDTFVYSTTLVGGWTVEQFTGGLRFTLRKKHPPSTVIDDTDADVVASVTTTDGSITGSGVNVMVTIPAAVAKLWPSMVLVWDLQGIINATPNHRVETIDDGDIYIQPDVSRTG